jgi:hypothetical protein
MVTRNVHQMHQTLRSAGVFETRPLSFAPQCQYINVSYSTSAGAVLGGSYLSQSQLVNRREYVCPTG